MIPFSITDECEDPCRSGMSGSAVSTEIFSFSHHRFTAVLACPRERPSQQADKIYEWILDESNLPQSNYIEIRPGNI